MAIEGTVHVTSARSGCYSSGRWIPSFGRRSTVSQNGVSARFFTQNHHFWPKILSFYVQTLDLLPNMLNLSILHHFNRKKWSFLWFLLTFSKLYTLDYNLIYSGVIELFITWKSYSFVGDYLLKHSEFNHFDPKIFKFLSRTFTLLTLFRLKWKW